MINSNFDVNQTKLIRKFKSYIELQKKRDPTRYPEPFYSQYMKKIFTHEGFCNGESHLWGNKILPAIHPPRNPETGEILDPTTHQTMIKKKKEFDLDMIKISEWDETLGGLNKELAEIFERRLNDIIAYFDPKIYLSEGIDEGVAAITQESLPEVSRLLSDNPLDLEFNVPLLITEKEIETFLPAYLPEGVFIRIASPRHATGCVKNNDEYIMFDPNNSKGEIIARNMQNVATNIENFLGQGNPYMELFISHFSPLGEPMHYQTKEQADKAKIELLENLYQARKKSDAQYSINIQTQNAYTQLGMACNQGDSVAVQWCLNKINLEAQAQAKELGKENDQKFISRKIKEAVNLGRKPLMLAAYSGNIKIIEILLNHGAELFPEGENFVFIGAIRGKKRAVVKMLLEYAKVQQPQRKDSPLKRLLGTPHEGKVPLIWAVDSDDVDLADDLIKAGADVNAGNYPETALGIAVSNGNLSMARKLIFHGANINFQEGLSENPLNSLLSKAIDNQDIRMVRLLYENGAKIEGIENKLIDFCIDQNDLEMLRAMMGSSENEILIQFYDRFLSNAIKKNNLPLLTKLLSLDNININQFRDKRENVLAFALKNFANKNIIEVLLARKEIDLTQVDADDQNILMIALYKRVDKKIIQLLLKREGWNWTQVDNDEMNVLMRALKYGDSEIIKLLLERKEWDWTQVDRYGRNALMIAIEEELDIEIIEAILAKKGLNVNQISRHSTENQNALMVAILYHNKEAIKRLLSREDLDLTHVNDNGKNALMHALKYGGSEIVQLLLKRDDWDWTQVDNDGMNVLMRALKYEDSKSVKLLLEKDDWDWTQVDDDGNNVLTLAINHNADKEIVLALLDKKGLNITHTNKQKQNALLLALEKKLNKEIVLSLLKKEGWDWNQVNKDGRNALMIAIELGDIEIIEALLEKESLNLNQLDNKDKNVLMIALDHGNKEIIKRLLSRKNLDLTHVNDGKKNALMIALECLDSEIIQLMLKREGWDWTQVDDRGDNVLTLALNCNQDEEIVLALLEKEGLNIAHTNKKKQNALILALEKNSNKEIILALLKRKEINLAQISKDGQNALMIALEKKSNKEIIPAILSREDLDLTQTDNEQRNALMIALVNSSEDIIKLLLKRKEINLAQVDSYGNNALMIALRLQHKPEIIKEILQRKDLDLSQVNSDGENALKIALEMGVEQELIDIIEDRVKFEGGEKPRMGP